MTFWLLYLIIDGQSMQDYPYYFAYRETCDKVGKEVVKEYKYQGYKCVQWRSE